LTRIVVETPAYNSYFWEAHDRQQSESASQSADPKADNEGVIDSVNASVDD